jgi:hypothetical protein
MKSITETLYYDWLKKKMQKDMQMLASVKRFNLIKVITLAVVLGYIVFAMLASSPNMLGAFF